MQAEQPAAAAYCTGSKDDTLCGGRRATGSLLAGRERAAVKKKEKQTQEDSTSASESEKNNFRSIIDTSIAAEAMYRLMNQYKTSRKLREIFNPNTGCQIL